MTTLPPLPPLPEPHHRATMQQRYQAAQPDLFRADQMRAYGAACAAAANQRKPLTDEQIADIVTTVDRTSDDLGPFFDVARAVEAAHGIKEAP